MSLITRNPLKSPSRSVHRPGRRVGIALGAAAAAVTLLASCSNDDEEHDAALRDALAKVCPEPDDIKRTDADPGEPPEYSGREQEWADGLEARAKCGSIPTEEQPFVEEPITADLYEGTNPVDDMEDRDQTYNSADGTSVYWAVREVEHDRWVAVYIHENAEVLAPLADEGYELGGGPEHHD